MPAPSFDDLFNLGKAELILKRPSLGLRIGDISEMLISGAAAMADRLIGWFAERIAATFLDGASGTDLTELASDHWNISRRLATSSIATITLNRASATATAQNFPIGTTFATATDSQGNDIRFTSTQAASWGVSENGNKTVAISASVAGVTGNLLSANLITRIISTLPAGGTYTIVSSTQPAGGSEEETDEELRDRVRIYPSTLRRGTLAALEYGAKSLSTISVAKASAIQDGTGLVTVYVSDASGISTGTATTIGPLVVDDGTMTKKVAIELLNWACAGSLVNVSGGAVQTVNISVSVTVKIGVDVNQLIANIQDSVAGRVNKLNIGETLYLSDIISAVKIVDPDNIVNVVVTDPVTNTAPSTPGNIIRPGSVTVS
jgi:hypothetical protein